MIEKILQNIKDGIDIRQNLSELRKEIKDRASKLSLLYKLGNNYNLFIELLDNEDPKVRKNVALLLGELGIQEALEALYKKYETEDKLFIKSAYIIAMGNLDCKKYLGDLKERINALSKTEITVENKKHISEEMKVLTDIVVKYEGIEGHEFTGFHTPSSMVLLTNRNYVDATLKQLEGMNAKEFNAGIMLQTDQLENVLAIRTYQEALFIVPGMKSAPADANKGANTIVSSSLLKFLLERHKGEAPFYFRVEVKSKMPLDKKSEFAKKLSSEIELLSERKFINSTSNYEFEIRAIQNKEGNFNLLVKLFTILDDRFSYRQKVIATSIKPTIAALVAELAIDYMKQEAKVLDPFCGVGTMLIERHKKVKANTMYGIDRLEEAIEGARINTKEAHQIAHYINRDFFDFTHEYLFDEVVTNMPFQIGRVTQEEINELYQSFFVKIKQHLNDDGIIIMYSHDRDLVKNLAPQNGFEILQVFEISMKEGTYLYILKLT
jgi:tRNA G10  N-methylase Trm11